MASKSVGRVLNDRRLTFCAEYVKDLHTEKAAVRAGYSKRTAASQGRRLLQNVAVQAEIQKRMAAKLERCEIDADWLLKRLVELANVDLAKMFRTKADGGGEGRLLDLGEMPEDCRRLIAGFEVTEEFQGKQKIGYTTKVRLRDTVRVLELIGKHIEVLAFVERHATVDQDELVRKIQAGRDRLAAKKRTIH